MMAPERKTAGHMPGWMRPIDRLMDHLATVMLGGSSALLAMMLVLNLINIFMRNLGFGSLLWVSAWTGVMMVWCVFLSFYPMYRRSMDITLTIFIARLGPLANRIFHFLTAICGIIVCGLLVAELPNILARQRGELELVGLQRYWLSIPLILSSALIVVHFALEILGSLLGWRQARITDETEQLQW